MNSSIRTRSNILAIMAFAVMAAGVTTLSRTTPIHLEASRPTRL